MLLLGSIEDAGGVSRPKEVRRTAAAVRLSSWHWGYDPEAGIGVWERMAAMSDGKRPPEILSTHPDPTNRIENMRKWMPKALEYYRASEQKQNRKLPPIK